MGRECTPFGRSLSVTSCQPTPVEGKSTLSVSLVRNQRRAKVERSVPVPSQNGPVSRDILFDLKLYEARNVMSMWKEASAGAKFTVQLLPIIKKAPNSFK
ncbi:hypothetical protein KM043_018066 [Ampulex compressa]|nr:hypothetical protein KM043_018066 [Ampulex compressa]